MAYTRTEKKGAFDICVVWHGVVVGLFIYFYLFIFFLFSILRQQIYFLIYFNDLSAKLFIKKETHKKTQHAKNNNKI